MEDRHLHILWMSGDIQTSKNLVMIYATNSMLQRWWDDVTVIIWGAATELVAHDADIRESVNVAEHSGVKFSVDISCARQMGVLKEISEHGLNIKPWGETLSKLIATKANLLTI